MHGNGRRDIALLNLVGLHLYRLITKARERTNDRGNISGITFLRQGGSDEPVGYEAAMSALFLRRER